MTSLNKCIISLLQLEIGAAVNVPTMKILKIANLLTEKPIVSMVRSISH